MSKEIPARWFKYTAHGSVIKNTKIFAFKVPLKYDICKDELPSEQFTPQILMKRFPNLKYIIDMTATTRYYAPTEFTKKGVQYVKLVIRGRSIPRPDLVVKFANIMDHFMASVKEDELIGVHCTHGLNRTGFMVCKYLVHKLGWDMNEAIKEFEAARGHKMEREAYLAELNPSLYPKKIIENTASDSDVSKNNKQTKKSKSKSQRGKNRELPTNRRGYPTPGHYYNKNNSHYSFTHNRQQHTRDYSYHHSPYVTHPFQVNRPSLPTQVSQSNINPQHLYPSQYRITKRSSSQFGGTDFITSNIAEKIRRLENSVELNNTHTYPTHKNNSNPIQATATSQTIKRIS